MPVTVEYLPRNDNVLIQTVGESHFIKAVGPEVSDLRVGDRVVLPDFDEGDEDVYRHVLDEEGDLFLVREQLILAVEKVISSVQEAYEEFHS